jgi:uncharacterized protein (TIGR03083 family)
MNGGERRMMVAVGSEAMGSIDHSAFCDALESEATAFAETVAGADPATPVPTCPDWTLAELIRHLGGVHRWAAHHVATLAPRRVSSSELSLGPPDDPTKLAAWAGDGVAPMVATFRAGDPDAKVWGWGADRHVRFWPRRMLYETMVHRADGALAVGAEPDVDDRLAADAIDELLENLPHAAYFAPGVGNLRGDGERIALRTRDGGAWHIRLLPAGFSWDWSSADADVTVIGNAADLLLLLYGRRSLDDTARFAESGDGALIRRFIANAAL